ncbi:uncharacterized protein [Porites lutea]|uniref:uncharacterized protein n=1 Tax=Porites lutea TaxID=51062 RepID=UPI003CC5CCB7
MLGIKLWSLLLLIILLGTLITSFPSRKRNCEEFSTGKCVNKKSLSGSYKNDTSWICRGKFGILDLNCSIMGAHKTSQQGVSPCCEATITAGNRTEIYHKDIHAVVTSDLNKTIEVPANTTKQSQASLRLMPGFIDITHGLFLTACCFLSHILDRLAIVAVVFKFDALCKNTKELTVDPPGSKRRSALKAPIVSFTAITNRGSLKMLQNNATITFRTKSQSNSTACRFLDSSSGNTPFWSGSGLTYVHSQDQNSSSTICLTNHFTSFAVLVSYHGQDESKAVKFSKDEKKALDLITKIGCGIAIVCLVACIFTFACVRSLSILRYRIHLNLCISLAGSLLLFVAGIEATDIKGVCIAVAVMLHYFFTASFAWMCVEAIHLFTKVVSVFDVQTTKMRYYFALGWGLPAVIVVISLSANYKGYSTSKVCWLEGDSAWAFIVPVIIIVLINIAVLVAVVAVRVSLKGHPLTPNEDKRFTAALKAVVILFPLLGLCWVFGLVGVVARSKAFLYAFVVLSTFQGVFILLFHCIGNIEVRSALKKVQERHSLNTSIKNEQKNKSKDYRLKRMHKDNITSTSEKKGLLEKLSVARCNRRQRNDPTAIIFLLRLSTACPISNATEKFEYSPECESVIIDTGNETRKPQIQIVTTGTNNLIKTYQGCSTKHQYTDDMGLQWTYQVARFRFVNTVKIGNPVYIGGAKALSLEGENIVVDEKGSFEVDINSSTSFQSASFVGGFVPKIGYSAPPYNGPGRGNYSNLVAGGAGHGGQGGGGDNVLASSYGAVHINQYLGGSTGGFTGPNLPGIGGPAMELKAVGALKIGGRIIADAHSLTDQLNKHDLIAGSSGGLVRLLAQKVRISKPVSYLFVNISQSASISLKGLNGLCGRSPCQACGGSGGIFQVISHSGYIAPNTVSLNAGNKSNRCKTQAENGFLYISELVDFLKIELYVYAGRFIVGIVVFNNLTSHFTKKHQPSNNRKDDGQIFLNSEIISVIASYDGKPVQRLEKDALLTFEKKTSDGKEPLCVFWKPVPGERKWSSEGLSLITTNKQQIICSTNHLTSFSVLMRWTDVKVSPGDKYALDVITYIGSGVSLVALACAIIIFLCLGRSLSAIRYRIHLNLCIALAVAQVVFLSGIEASSSPWICTTVAVLLHYLYTASFTWMCAEGLHLYFKIVTAFNLHRIRMIYYVILGWGFPVVVVGISATTRIKGYGATDLCWLSLSFIGPVIGIIAFNVLILGLIIKTLMSLSNVAASDPRENIVRSGVKAALMLMHLLGTTWVLGLLSVNSDTVVFQYLFAIVNSLQGLFIFACHCIGNSEVRTALTKLKNRHSTKIAFSREVKSVKPKRKTKGLKGSKFDAENQRKNIVLLVVDPAELELKDID